MKPDARAVERLLRAPGPLRVVLLHGDDTGLVHERAAALVRTVLGPDDDPFRLAVLDRDGHGRLSEEATALALTGGRRAVRVRDAVDALAPAIERVLAGGGDTLLVLEAGALPARAKLRALLEPHPEAAVIGCYPEEGRALAGSLERMVADAGARIEPDALAVLADRLGADRLASRSEVEKLALYAGPDAPIDVAAVEACSADASAASLDDALYAATAGDVAATDRALDRAIADGAAPVAMARALLSHLAKLRAARRHMDADGIDAGSASRTARPPVFFRRQPAFARALGRWPVGALHLAAAEAQAVELGCKRTGAPDLLLIRQLLLQVARAAERRGGPA